MTRQKTFKRRVRERMTRTGESYTAARRMLIAKGDRPDTTVAPFEPPVTEERVVEATGRGWQAWFELLDAWEAASRSHTEIARWLREEHGVDGWYSQSITLGYERGRGLRAPGQRPDGFAVSATRTVAVPVERLFEYSRTNPSASAGFPEPSCTCTRPRRREAPATTGRTARPESSSALTTSARRRAGWRSRTSGCPMPKPPTK
jgi:hypothetical protein